jgi:hypothetical protein
MARGRWMDEEHRIWKHGTCFQTKERTIKEQLRCIRLNIPTVRRMIRFGSKNMGTNGLRNLNKLARIPRFRESEHCIFYKYRTCYSDIENKCYYFHQ